MTRHQRQFCRRAATDNFRRHMDKIYNLVIGNAIGLDQIDQIADAVFLAIQYMKFLQCLHNKIGMKFIILAFLKKY